MRNRVLIEQRRKDEVKIVKMRILTGFLSFGILLAFLSAPAWGGDEEALKMKLDKATFAGGCFWCMEPPFDKLEGVVSTVVGYTGGHKKNPTYAEVSSGSTGHAEAIEIRYDPSKISYAELLEVFWHNVDPFVKDRQFCDVGFQYRAAVFYHDDGQKGLAEASIKALEQSKGTPGPVYTEIVPAGEFYPAEDYHQEYYKKNPFLYKFYRYNCGRDQRLKEIWGDM